MRDHEFESGFLQRRVMQTIGLLALIWKEMEAPEGARQALRRQAGHRPGAVSNKERDGTVNPKLRSIFVK
jgi:hypothetical protein